MISMILMPCPILQNEAENNLLGSTSWRKECERKITSILENGFLAWAVRNNPFDKGSCQGDLLLNSRIIHRLECYLKRTGNFVRLLPASFSGNTQVLLCSTADEILEIGYGRMNDWLFICTAQLRDAINGNVAMETCKDTAMVEMRMADATAQLRPRHKVHEIMCNYHAFFLGIQCIMQSWG